jgi:cobalt-zinc-cadmium efflux system membrane fusion protein
MNRKMARGAAATLTLILGFAWGCDGRGPAENGGEHAGHGEEERDAGRDLAMSLEEILAARCEHDLPTHQCAECRYEVGVVRLSASTMKGTPGVKNGLIETALAVPRKLSSPTDVTGEIQMNENTAAHLSPRISGIIRSVKVDIGAQVKTGEVLFEVESVELGRAVSDYQKSRKLVELSRRNYEREKSLFDRKIGAERTMIDARMVYEQHQAELDAAEQRLHVLGLTEEQLAELIRQSHAALAGRLAVRAPLDGTIIRKHAVVGELASPGTDVMLIADLRSVWAWANIYEQDLAPLLERRREGPMAVDVLVDAFPGRAFSGTLDYVGATMDESTRTVKVRVTVGNEERLLRPGMFCHIRIKLAPDEEVLAIPREALHSDEGKQFVFKPLKDDYYFRRPVEIGRTFDDYVEVVEGLEPGETIVVDGSFLLKSDVLRSKMGAGCAD